MSKPICISLTVVRHGQTDGYVKRLVDGITDTPLNNNGRHQAKCAGEWLKNEAFDRVYASDLKRASETASIIVEENLTTGKNHDDVVKLPILRERGRRSRGPFEGVSTEELNKAAANAGMNWLTYTPEGGETLNDVKIRAKKFMEELCDMKQSVAGDKLNILVVTHGFVIAQLIIFLCEEVKCDGSISVGEIQTAWANSNDGILLLRMPNTAITKFELEVDSCNKKLKAATCTLYKSNAHLQ